MLIRTSILVAGLGLLGPSMPAAHAQDYGEWRALTSDEEKARIDGVRPGSLAPAVVEADFDGDGTTDRVLIAIRKADDARGVIAVIGERVLVIVSDIREAPNGLGLADPASHDTICGKDFRDSHKEACDDYPARVMLKLCNGHAALVTLKHPGFVRMEGPALNLFVWDSRKRHFVQPSWINPAKLGWSTGVFCVDSRRIDPAVAAATTTPARRDAKRRADLVHAAP